MTPRIYMDANATTPLLPDVFDAMRPWLLESFGNPSSVHQPGQLARAAVDRARDQLATLLDCRPSELVFTSGGTESDNLALFGTLTPGDHCITSAVEHHAVLHAANALQQRGVQLTVLPCDASGLIAPESLAAALRPDTRLVSILFASNETGVLQPIPQLAALTRAHGALFHTDAVQAAGKLPLSLATTHRDIDLLTLSGHKLHAPQGIGALFVRRGTPLAPILHGGMHERQRRAGTENVPAIVALGHAAALAARWIASGGPAALATLRDTLERDLLARIPSAFIHAAHILRTPNTTSLCIPGLDAESLLIAADLRGLALSAGSACTSGATEPSHVLTAMGLPPELARATVRISLSRLNTPAEITAAATILATAAAHLRATT